MSNKIRVGIATYGEVIDSLKDPERWLIDVRDPEEIAITGQIPTSINIPCKLSISNYNFLCHYQTLLIFYSSGDNLRRVAFISSGIWWYVNVKKNLSKKQKKSITFFDF